MSLTGRWAVLAVSAVAISAPVPASAREPQLEIHAEWITPACQFPARFRVTLRNTGDEAFSVPLEQTFGRGRPVNFKATLDAGVFAYNGERHFSSEYFFTPPPTLTNLVDLDPGASQAFDLEFDGVFDAHGAVRPTYEGRWQGRFVFYYYLPAWFVAGTENSPPILTSADEVSAWSNGLDCT